MSAIKTILCSMIGALFALAIHDNSLKNETAQQITSSTSIITTPIQQTVKTNTNVKSELTPDMAELTIVNGSHNQVHCRNGLYQVFLTLNPNEQQRYNNIKEGSRIGCSALGDARLTWFYAANGVYTVLAERDKTVIMTDKGEIIK